MSAVLSVLSVFVGIAPPALLLSMFISASGVSSSCCADGRGGVSPRYGGSPGVEGVWLDALATTRLPSGLGVVGSGLEAGGPGRVCGCRVGGIGELVIWRCGLIAWYIKPPGWLGIFRGGSGGGLGVSGSGLCAGRPGLGCGCRGGGLGGRSGSGLNSQADFRLSVAEDVFLPRWR